MSARKIRVKFLALMAVFLFSGLTFGEHMVLINDTPTYFEYRRTITIQSGQVVGGPHSNFPMLFDSTKVDSGLRDDLKLWPTGKVKKSNGDDIVFATGYGIEILKHEIEKYDNSTGEYIAWVRIESINNGTVIYLYYGSDDSITYPANFTTDVWSNGYRGVWHLSETAIDEQTTATHNNSCSANNDGSQNGNASTGGKIASGQDVELDDYIDVPHHSSIDFGANEDFTVSVWLNSSQSPGPSLYPMVVSKEDANSPRQGYSIFTLCDDTPPFDTYSFFDTYSNGTQRNCVVVTGGLVDGTWHYVAAKREGSNLYTYFDGDYTGNSQSSAGGSLSKSVPLRMGVNPDGDSWSMYEGSIDEVRISGIARPNGWIKTEHNNQNQIAPGSFYSISGPTLVELSYFRAKGLNSAVLLEWATETELDNAGFNVWRSEEKDGEYVRINPYFIPAEGEAGFGAEYSHADYDVKNGVTYYYLLEDVDFCGKSTLHGPVSATPNEFILIWPPDREVPPSDVSLFSWASTGSLSFKVEISTNPSFPASETISFPEEGWTSDNPMWLTPREREIVLRKARQSGGQLFWRVRAKSPDGSVARSEWRKLVLKERMSPGNSQRK